MDEIDEPASVANRLEQEFVAAGLGSTDAFRGFEEREQSAREARAEQKSRGRSMLQSLPTLGSANVTDVYEEISRVIDRTYSYSTDISAISLLYFVIGLIAGPAIVAVWDRHNYGAWLTIVLYVLAFFLGMLISIFAYFGWLFVTEVPYNTNYLWAWTRFNPGNETNTPPSKFAKVRATVVALFYPVVAAIGLLVLRKYLHSYFLDAALIGILITASALLLWRSGPKGCTLTVSTILWCAAAVAVGPLLLLKYDRHYLFGVLLISIFAATSALLFVSIVSLRPGINATLACVSVGAICFVVLREHLNYVVDMLLISVFTAASASLFALIGSRTDSTKRYRRTWPSAPGEVLPLDYTIINFLNLSYFLHMASNKEDSESYARQALKEIEYAARDAETELPGRYGAEVRRDQRGASWAQETSLCLAESIRLFKRTLMMSARPKEFQNLRDDVTSALVAAASRDWEALLTVSDVSRAPALLRRWAWRLAPTVILVAMAFLLPLLLGIDFQSATATGVRISLLISAVLSLLAAFNPDIGKTSDIIQKAQDKLISGPKGSG